MALESGMSCQRVDDERAEVVLPLSVESFHHLPYGSGVAALAAAACPYVCTIGFVVRWLISRADKYSSPAGMRFREFVSDYLR